MNRSSFSLLKVQGLYLFAAASLVLFFDLRAGIPSRPLLLACVGIVGTGLVLLYAAFRELKLPVLLPFCIALVLMLADVFCYLNKSLPRVFLADAFTELIICICWIQLFTRMKTQAKS